MAWQYSDFIRIVCIAQCRHAALQAIESRIERLRAAGLEIPPEAMVEVRPSGFGFAAELMVPERYRVGLSVRLNRRTHSMTAPTIGNALNRNGSRRTAG